jgi:hypothetical protein
VHSLLDLALSAPRSASLKGLSKPIEVVSIAWT